MSLRRILGVLSRAVAVAGAFAALPWVLATLGLPAPALASGMLALPLALFAVLRREDRRLGEALGHHGRDRAGGDGLGPALRRLLLWGRR
jgi:hypothetical protein